MIVTRETLRLALTETFFLVLMAVVLAILGAAMTLQYAHGELPCPLCLLQRVALLGVCFGIMQNFRHGFSDRNLGFCLLFAIFLLIVAVRQTLLDIAPRPGHEYVGSAVLGLHMPVWSVLIAVAIIAAIALKLVVLGSEQGHSPPRLKSVTGRIAAVLGLLVIATAAVNSVSVVVQCGLGQCDTERYFLLG